MPATKQNDTQPAPEVKLEAPASAEPPKKDIMGIERDDKHARVLFSKDNGIMIITMPIGGMSRTLVHGFIYELHEIVNEWFEERKKHQIITRDNMNRFSFKQSVGKLFGKI